MKNVTKIILGSSLLVATMLSVGCRQKNRIDTIYLDKKNIEFPASGQGEAVKLYFTQDWSASITEGSWLSVEPKSGKAAKPNSLDSVMVYFSAKVNDTAEERFETVKFSTELSYQSIMVKQKATDEE